MKLNLKSRRLRFCICCFTIPLLLIGLLVFWPSRKPELVWRLLSVTETNGTQMAEVEMVNSGRDDLVVIAWWAVGDSDNRTELGKDRGPSGISAIGTPLFTVPPGAHVRMKQLIPNNAALWSSHVRVIPITPEARLTLWMDRNGWLDRLPDSLKLRWDDRFEKTKLVVSGGPFTNTASINSQK